MYYSVSLDRSGLFEVSLWERREEQPSNQDATWINSASFWPSTPVLEVAERRQAPGQDGKIRFQITFLQEVLLYGVYSLTPSEAGIPKQRERDLFG